MLRMRSCDLLRAHFRQIPRLPPCAVYDLTDELATGRIDVSAARCP
jgi:hypothetical protein